MIEALFEIFGLLIEGSIEMILDPFVLLFGWGTKKPGSDRSVL